MYRYAPSGLGAMYTGYLDKYGSVPPSPGVSVDVAQGACKTAKGVWDDGTNGCRVPDIREIPGWCYLVPFQLGFDACRPLSAADIAAGDGYLAYEVAQKPQAAAQLVFNPNTGQLDPGSGGTVSGQEAAAQIMASAQESADWGVKQLGCSYDAALKHPLLTQLVGPDAACAIVGDGPDMGWGPWLVLGGVLTGIVVIASR